jgi:hypothetical protein
MNGWKTQPEAKQRMPKLVALWRTIAAGVVTFAFPALAAADENISIETLLKAGWQIVGYAAANQSAVESALILFQHPGESYLVQCRASHDVTRSPSVNSNCYKLR